MKLKLLFLLLFTALLSFAQNPTDVEHNFGARPGCSGPVQKMVVQQDGKIIVQASSQFFNGIQVKKALIRINADGSLDPTFDYNPVTNIFIKSFALQPDGKILVGGFKGDLFRINTDGSTDTAFNSTLNFEKDSYINCIAVQPDGKILVTNKSDSQWIVPLKYLTRLNADGSIDSTFSIGTGFFNKPINALAVQSDGKILVVSEFSFFQVNAQKNLIRLNADGTKDNSFDIGTGFNGYIYSMILQNDGKIIVGGNFSFYQGIAQLYLIRLNTDGSKDTSLINPSNFKYFNDRGVYDASDICLQTDGKIIVNFHKSNESSSTDDDFIYRFNSDGSLDTSFAKVNFNHRGKRPLTPYYYDADVHTIAVLNNGKIIIGGDFSFCRNVIENNIVFLNADGSKDSSFYKETGFDKRISSTAIQTDGKTLVAGDFDNFKGITQPELIRINADASIDTSFKLDGVFKGGIRSILLQADGKILVMGPFENYINIGRNYLVRLNPNGSLDTSFTKIFDFDYFVDAMALQPDGKILLCAFVDNWPNLPYRKLFRLNTDGSEDISFDAGRNDFSKGVFSIVVQNDGKILVGGAFTTFNNIAQKYLIRLNPNGSKDTSFDIGTIFDFSTGVRKITMQPDGKILVNGTFSPTAGDYQSYLIRLNSDGSKDVSFNQGIGLDSVVTDGYDIEIRSLVLQNDGKILIGGAFDTYQGITQNRLTRLNNDGSIDTSFDIGAGFDNQVESLSIYPDGKIIVGGVFSSYRGVSSPHLIRLKGTPVQPIINANTIQTNLTCAGISTGSASILSVYNGKSPYSYLWSNGATTATITGLAAGNYSCTITDADSSTVTKRFIIITDSDFQKPTITAPANLTINANANCTATGVVLGTPITTDNCAISTVTNNAPSVFPIGNTTVTWTVKDASNNDATATQIIIVKDVTKPTIFPPAPITVNITSNCTVTGIVLGTPITADNCSVVSLKNNAPTTFYVGNTTVTWTVKDANNNIATATQIVTVKDITLPTITPPPSVIVNANLNGTATGIVLGTPITADNCAIASVTNNAPTTFYVGNRTVTWTVKDASNNIATATQIVTVTNSAPTTLIPDLNFEKKLIALGIDSGTTDGKVLTSKINSLTTLDVSKSSINDLTGIQDFVALTSLTCYSNQLTFLDISKNVALTSLSCYLNQLTSIDISKNVALKTLTCSSNQLKSLDISQNIALTRLSCNANQLTSLDVSKNVELTNFTCDTNQLTNLDISKNTKLIVFHCFSNKLTSLDVSVNITLGDLYCYSNQLKSLDVSKNVALKYLVCYSNQLPSLDVSKNVALKYLDCYSNQLTSLDVSINVALFYLNCITNQLTSLDVSKNVALFNLYCNSNQLTSLDVSKNIVLKSFSCSSNQLTSLNLKNGKNTLLVGDPNIRNSFTNNPNLRCIQVDDKTYSDANWTNFKDATASYSSSCPTLAVGEVVFDKVSIYPNPVKGQLHIDNIVLEKVTVYDALGKLIKTKTFTTASNNNTLDLADFAKGAYFIYLQSEDTNIVRKVIVE